MADHHRQPSAWGEISDTPSVSRDASLRPQHQHASTSTAAALTARNPPPPSTVTTATTTTTNTTRESRSESFATQSSVYSVYSVASSQPSIRRKPLPASATPLVAVDYSRDHLDGLDDDLPQPEHRFARSPVVDSPTLYDFPQRRPVAPSLDSLVTEGEDDALEG
jgi:hypothetical protein